jgi:serine/threonine-protein kinase
VADRYAIDRLIVRGGVAEVYRARDTLDGNADVALKLIPAAALADPAARRHFERSADVRRLVTHPSVVHVFDHGELPDGRIYVAMEFVEGEDLRERLSGGRPLDQARAVGILGDVCAGVEAAHRAGIVHGDLKPENIMLPREGGPPKVVDFIGVRRVEPDGTIIGTPAYMAPEQLRGDPPCARSDVFSLGVMAFEMLTGRLPFGRGSAGEVLLQQVRGVPRMAGVNACFDAAVRAALSRDPDRRPPSAAAFAQLLESARPT